MYVVIWSALLSLVGMLHVAPAVAQSSPSVYPSGPVRIIAPGPPGSPRDIRARWTAEKLTAALGQPVIVENRPGAGGNIGMEAAARSAPDGRTLVIVDVGTLAQNPHLHDRPGYNALTDFIPVITLVESPLVLATHAELPVRSVDDLVKLARQKPGQFSYGSSGIGTPPHLAGEQFKRMANIDVVHVPYKGASPALVDLMAGRIAYTIDNPGLQLPQASAGKIRALAVTGSKRIEIAPEVPTLAESGFPEYEYTPWMGLAAPAGTPRKIVDRLNADLARALSEPGVRDWFKSQGAAVVADTPDVFAKRVRDDYARWGKIIRAAGIKAE